MGKHVLKIEPDSEAEKYFVNDIMPNCKDKVICRLGIIYGVLWNEYEITHDDYNRCREFIKRKRGA